MVVKKCGVEACPCHPHILSEAKAMAPVADSPTKTRVSSRVKKLAEEGLSVRAIQRRLLDNGITRSKSAIAIDIQKKCVS
jgi:hypothetical protein